MSPRIALPLILSLLLLACGGQDAPPADAAAPVVAEPAPVEAIADEPALDPDAAAAEPAAEGEAGAPPAGEPADTPVDAPAAAAPAAAPLSAPTAVPGLVEGRDYQLIPGGQPFEAGDGRIEVAEVFAYWCGTCAQFDPVVEAWAARLPTDVHFVYVPAVFNPQDNYPKAFFAAQALGIDKKSHSPTFRAIHLDRKLRPNASADDLARHYAGYGVDAATFASTMQSFAVNAKVSRARQFATRSQVGGTPAIVVNGRYHVPLRGSLEAMLQVTDAVVAHERASAAR
jgi:protein dithiol oxidoreductase (disulfide-forming)